MPRAATAEPTRSKSARACGSLAARDERRAASLARVAVQRELRDQQQRAAGVEHGPIHQSVVVAKDAQVRKIFSAIQSASHSSSSAPTPTSTSSPVADLAGRSRSATRTPRAETRWTTARTRRLPREHRREREPRVLAALEDATVEIAGPMRSERHVDAHAIALLDELRAALAGGSRRASGTRTDRAESRGRATSSFTRAIRRRS